MKKVLMLLVVSLIFVSVTLSQGLIAKGAKAGINFSNWSGSDAPSGWESKTGYTVGGFITYGVDNDFAVQPEVYYTLKGSQTTRTLMGTSYTSTVYTSSVSIDYLEVAILAKYLLAAKGNTTPGLFAGPAIAFKRSGKYKIAGVSQTQNGELQNVADTDFGIVLGADWSIALSSGAVLIDVRYDLGLSNIALTNPSTTVKNQVFSMLVGYSF